MEPFYSGHVPDASFHLAMSLSSPFLADHWLPFTCHCFPIFPLLIYRPFYCVNEGLVIDRFPEKGYSSKCPGEASRHLIVIGRNANDRYSYFSRCQFLLKVQSCHAWHPHIQNDTATIAEACSLKKFLGGAEGLSIKIS